MAKSFGNWFYSIKSEYRVILLGNLFLLVLFFSLFFLFFNGNIDWPLGVLTAIPFANLNYFLFIKSVDGVLATKSKGIFRIDFFVRYIILLIPIALSLILWYYSIRVINPIAIGISYIVYRIGLYLPFIKDVGTE